MFVVCDELAQWRGRDLYDALVTGTGAHTDALMVTISTMSADPNSVMSEQVRYGQQAIDGAIVDPTFLPIIYAAPQEADPWDEKVWRKCNPALGDFRSLDESAGTMFPIACRQGFIEATPGRAIDKSFVVHRLGEIASEFKVEAMAYDRWGSKELLRIIEDEGLKLRIEPWGQGWQDMAPALDAMEKLVLNRELRHDGHPVLRWCVANAIAIMNPAGGRTLAKDRSTGRIDGLQAASMAVGLAARTPPKRPSVYEGRGLLVLGADAA